MAQTSVEQESRYLVSYTKRDVLLALLVGAAVGAAVWILTWLFDTAIFDPVMCRVADATRCDEHFNYAGISAQLIAGVLGLVMLVRQLAYRPLLVVLAATITLWGLVRLAWEWPWFASLPALIVLYALAYGLFIMLARLRNLVVSVVAIVVMVVLIRLAMTS